MPDGVLPGCRPEPDSRFVYILDNAVETFSMDRSKAGGDKPPVPPCIVREDSSSCRIALEVDDHADHASILKVDSQKVGSKNVMHAAGCIADPNQHVLRHVCRNRIHAAVTCQQHTLLQTQMASCSRGPKHHGECVAPRTHEEGHEDFDCWTPPDVCVHP